MPDSIEYCLNNADCVDHPDSHGRLCLQQCGLCHESPFLLVDGEPVVGENHEAILAAVTMEDDS